MVKVFLDEHTDNGRLNFGTDSDFYLKYNSSTSALELHTANSDGSNTDATILSIPSGGTAVRLPQSGGLVLDQVGSAKLGPSGSSRQCHVFEDFIGGRSLLDVGGSATDGTVESGPWFTHETETTANAVTHALVEDVDHGQLMLGLSTDAEVQVAWLGWDDVLTIPGDANPVMIVRLKTQAAAGAALDSATILTFGLQSARADDTDSTTYNAQIKLAGAMSILLESDDNSTNSDDKDSTIDLVDATFYEFKIDCSDTADVGFYYRTTLGGAWTELTDGVTTFTMAAAANLQPFVQIQKSADANDDEVVIDYIEVYWDRA